MVSWEGAAELGTVTGASVLVPMALKLNPITGWGLVGAGLVGGAVSAGWAYYNGADIWEAAEAGAFTAGTTWLGGAVMGRLLPKVGRAFGASAGKKEALEEGVAAATTAVDRAKSGLAAAKKNLAQAKAERLPRDVIAKRLDDVASARSNLAGTLSDLRTARTALRDYTPNALANLRNTAAGADPKQLAWLGASGGAAAGHYGRQYFRPHGYTGDIPIQKVHLPREGMGSLWIPSLSGIKEKAPQYAFSPVLAAYLAGAKVA